VRRWPAAALAVVVVVAAAVAVVLLRDDDKAAPRRTSLSVTTEVTELGSGTPVTHREVVEVDRPYRARLRVFAPDGSAAGGFVWTETGLFTLKAEGVQRSQDVAPGRPGPDSYLDVALPEAESQGLVRRDGTGSVLGRSCTWWLSRLPLDSVPLELPAGGEQVRSCVSAEGLVLSARWTSGGRVTVEREVVAVGSGPALTDQVLFGGAAPTGGLRLTQVRALDAPADPPLALRAVAPDGWAFDRAVVTATVGRPDGPAVADSDRAVYVRDGRVAVLDEAQDLTGPPSPLVAGEQVDLGSLGPGRLAVGFDGVSLRFLQPDGVVVTLSGHLTRAEALAWARALAAA
jgi:hypothetical protein